MGAVKINGTTSGSVSLEAPATGSDVTLTLPGTTMNLGTELASKLPIAGGKILQIVRDTDTTNRTTTSGTFVDVTGVSVTITPQKSDSAILLLAIMNTQAQGASGGMVVCITDSSNNAVSGAEGMYFELPGQSGGLVGSLTLLGYSTPATTSATTYKARFRSLSGTVAIRGDFNTTQIYAIEVSA